MCDHLYSCVQVAPCPCVMCHAHTCAFMHVPYAHVPMYAPVCAYVCCACLCICMSVQVCLCSYVCLCSRVCVPLPLLHRLEHSAHTWDLRVKSRPGGWGLSDRSLKAGAPTPTVWCQNLHPSPGAGAPTTVSYKHSPWNIFTDLFLDKAFLVLSQNNSSEGLECMSLSPFPSVSVRPAVART